MSKTKNASWKLLATGILEISRKVSHLSEETLGNGTPGGLKLQVHDLKLTTNHLLNSLEELHAELSRFREEVLSENSRTYGRRKTDLVPDTHDPFRKFVAWLTDKVLPALVIAVLLWISQVVFSGAVVLFLFTTGILTF